MWEFNQSINLYLQVKPLITCGWDNVFNLCRLGIQYQITLTTLYGIIAAASLLQSIQTIAASSLLYKYVYLKISLGSFL